jgi:cellulose synthase/poly-beta-1,6-N-acetylglucosamine synthase-like glycosyltransferase
MKSAEYVFWSCLVLVVYVYCLYPVLLFLVYSSVQAVRDLRYLATRRDRRARLQTSADLPPVSLIIPAYNEARSLPGKIINLEQLDYPYDKLEVIFVSDGSTDGTNAILQSLPDPRMRAVLLPVRRGKFQALNHGAECARHDIIVFSDASTLFAPDAVKNLVRHFSDPGLGVVCGAVRLVGNAESRQTEGLYWKYESGLRLMEARLGATLYASGCIYAVRRQCYRPLAPQDLTDDLVIPLRARKLGYRVLDDPEALATEFSADSVRGEFTRRVRLAAGGFRALKEIVCLPLWNFTGIAFLSHKLLRWILPFLLIGLLLSNAFLVQSPRYQMALLAQASFYLWAALGFLFRSRMQGSRYALFGYFLVTIQLAFLVGFWRVLFGRPASAWQRVS